jgi:hypothetical protein
MLPRPRVTCLALAALADYAWFMSRTANASLFWRTLQYDVSIVALGITALPFHMLGEMLAGHWDPRRIDLPRALRLLFGGRHAHVRLPISG